MAKTVNLQRKKKQNGGYYQCRAVGGLAVGGGGTTTEGSDPVLLRALFSKWNDAVFCSTMTAEHCVDYSVTGAKS